MRLLQELTHDRTVALVGNAESLLTEGLGAEIDAHDIVVRMNLGFPSEATFEHLGQRTDIWATAKHWPVDTTAKLIVFMKLTQLGDQHWRRFLMDRHRGPITRWPQWLEDEVKEFVGADPGTGIRMLYYLKRHCHPKSVSVYGMDCWETVSTWSGKKNTPNHSPELERKALERLLA